MKNSSSWFLRIVIVLMGLIGLSVCVFALPTFPKGIANEYPGVNNLLINLFVGGLYLSILPFFVALYQGLRLLTHIDKNQAFSQTSVDALKSIKYAGIVMSLCFVAGIPMLFHVAELDDAPGLGLVALAFACTPLAVTTFAAVLQKLLQNAIDIKSENDLTV